MSEPKNPLHMFLAGVAIIGFLEFLISGTGTLFAASYAVGVVALGCGVFYGTLNLAGDYRLHTPIGITVRTAGLLIAAFVTWKAAARLLSMLAALSTAR